MKKALMVLFVAGLVALGVVGVYRRSDGAGGGGVRPAGQSLAEKSPRSHERIRRRHPRNMARLPGPAAKADGKERERVKVFDETEAEALAFDEHVRTVLRQLQEALDNNDFESVKRLVMKLQEIARATGAESEMPRILRRKAVEALGWFGSKAVPELVGYLEDPDPEIAADAQSQLELALQDVDLADYEIAKIVLQLVKIVDDADSIDSYFMELTKMRNSVMIETIIGICQGGNEVAVSKVAENLNFLTGDDTIVTVEDARRWLAENPDGPDDDYFYGNKETSSNPDMVSIKFDAEKYLAEQERIGKELDELFRQREIQQREQEAQRQQEQLLREMEAREQESRRHDEPVEGNPPQPNVPVG